MVKDTSQRHAPAISRSRINRSLKLAAAAGRGAFRAAMAALPGSGRERRREEAMLRTADDVVALMGNMKGVTMKVGQVFSLMGGALPEGFAERFQTLQADAPPMAPELMRQVFIEDCGQPPEKIFRSFETRPFAAASIGQVHRAELKDRTKVAVKVQYPGVKEAIGADLSNLGMMFAFAGLAARGFDPGPVMEGVRRGILAELDYETEARHQAEFEAIFRGHPFIKVPSVYSDLSTKRVLVQEYIEGKPFAAAQTMSQPERDRIAEIIFRFTFGMLHRHGLFQADPHAGNYLLLPDGKVAFLDYGCISEFEPELVHQINELISGVVNRDLPRWRRALDAIGYVPPGVTLTTEEIWEQLKIYYTFVLEDNVTYTPEVAAALVRQNLQLTGEAGRVNRQLNIPASVVFTQRITFGFAGLMASIHATGPWQSITREYVMGDPPATALGQASRAHLGDLWV